MLKVAKKEELLNPDRLYYEGILFDNFVIHAEDKDEISIWANICQDCKKKFYAVEEYCTSDGSECICGVEGCSNSGEDCDEGTDYIDFPLEKVHFMYNFGKPNSYNLTYKEWYHAIFE